MLLAPAAADIAGKRLLIVAEGILQYLPFAALPEPGAREPLFMKHEIVTAPSASVLAVLRRETGARKPARKALFIAADPVYSASDERVGRQPVAAVSQREATRGDWLRSGFEPGAGSFERLRFSRVEAEQIAGFLPAAETVKAFDFDANRNAVLAADLGQFRILHFAAHSVLDDERAELSGIVLSLFDPCRQTAEWIPSAVRHL
jgi:CHAT domain-containing protein